MEPEGNPNPYKVIDSIKTPLAFFSLVVLICVSLLTILVRNSPDDEKIFLTRAILVILFFVVGLVAIAIFFKPEALWGKRYSALEDTFASGLGEDLFTALDGYLSNLEESTRVESYEQLRDILTSAPYARTNKTKKFCNTLVDTILRRANIRGEVQKKIGIAEKSKA